MMGAESASQCPGPEHERRVGLLEDLAALLGCHEGMGGQFPTGERPDVLRVCVERRMLFVGEAKDSEAPGCSATQVRLQRYLNWCRPWASRGTCVVALCFGDSSQRLRWVQIVNDLVVEADMDLPKVELTKIGSGLFVASFTWNDAAASVSDSVLLDL